MEFNALEKALIVESLEKRREGLAKHAGNAAHDVDELRAVLDSLNAVVGLIDAFEAYAPRAVVARRAHAHG